MTKRLFDENVYATTAEARIIERLEKGVVLDQTIFFPEGGGQAADSGTINGLEVKDVKEKEGKIIHYMDEQPKEDHVHLSIDWDKRLDEMQQHCGEHILSGVIKKLYDGNNKGFHIGKDYVTIDLDIKITNDMLDTIEDMANEAIYQNIALEITYANGKDDVDLPVRKDVTVDENIRIVTIPNVDCVACCGTHPNRTGDVGIIKLYKVEKNKKFHRIYFKCGKRALLDLRKKSKIISELNQVYSSDDDTLMERFENDKAKTDALKKAYITLNREKMASVIDDAIDEEAVLQKLIFDELSNQDMNYVIKRVSERVNSIVLLYSKSEQKVMLSHDGSFSVHCGNYFKSIKSYHGRGGGNAKVAQGVFEETEHALEFIKYLEVCVEGDIR